MSGTTFERPDSALLARARDLLARGAESSGALMAHVCQLPTPPGAVAEHLAQVLLGTEPDFARDPLGRWLLREAPPSTSALGSPAREATVVADRLRALSWIVVDVETTGTRARGDDRVTEIAAVVVRDGGLGEVFATLVNPERSIPPFITALTRITSDMVKVAPKFAEVCPTLLDVLERGVFTAHNAAFDWGFVSAEVERATGRQMAGRRLCTVRLARMLLPQLPRRSLDNVARYFGVEIGSRHRAAGDAIATAQVLLRLLQAAEDRGIETWDALERLLRRQPALRRKRRGSPSWVDKDTTA